MSSTFIAYVDESGDEGFAFRAGSSQWFVLSAIVTRRRTDLQTVKLVDEVRTRLGRPHKKPLHFRDLRHEHRLLYVDAIAKADLRTIAVLVHKPSLLEPEKFTERYRLYFYATRYFLERASWYCRDHKTASDSGDGSLAVVFSSRTAMAYAELREYLAHLRRRTGLLDVRIDWRVIREDQLVTVSPGRRMGLQIADAVGGSFYYAVQPSQYGFTEDRDARMLKPVVYNHKGTYLGYGLKLWPRDAAQLATEEHYRWIVEEYT